jgi:hypothetical protein
MISGSGSRPPSPHPVLLKELGGKGARSQDELGIYAETDEPMNKYEGCLGFPRCPSFLAGCKANILHSFIEDPYSSKVYPQKLFLYSKM